MAARRNRRCAAKAVQKPAPATAPIAAPPAAVVLKPFVAGGMRALAGTKLSQQQLEQLGNRDVLTRLGYIVDYSPLGEDRARKERDDMDLIISRRRRVRAQLQGSAR